MGIKETLDLLMRYPRLKSAQFSPDGEVLAVELIPEAAPVQAAQLPLTNDMPPDDVMLFAATEDIDELMQGRRADNSKGFET